MPDLSSSAGAGGHQRARRRWALRRCSCSSGDELGDACQLEVLASLRGTVADEFCSHLQSCAGGGRHPALRGTGWVPRRMEGGGLLLLHAPIVYFSMNRFENDNTRSSSMEELGDQKDTTTSENSLAVVPLVCSGSTAPPGAALL